MFIMTTSESTTGERMGLLRLRERGRISSGVVGAATGAACSNQPTNRPNQHR